MIGSLLMEQNEVIQNGKAVYSSSVYQALIESEVSVKLIRIAEEQLRLLAA